MRYPVILCVFMFFSCSPGPSSPTEKMEGETLACWSETWTGKGDVALPDGIQALDDYLFSQGKIGNRTIEDYKHFSTDTTTVTIPFSAPHFGEMQLALQGYSAGAPDVSFAKKCFDPLWLNKINGMDTTDILVRTGKLIQAMEKAGDPDYYRINGYFFRNITTEEFNRPLVKCMYYEFFVNHPQKIKFVFPPTSPAPNAPPPPPPPGH